MWTNYFWNEENIYLSDKNFEPINTKSQPVGCSQADSWAMFVCEAMVMVHFMTAFYIYSY